MGDFMKYYDDSVIDCLIKARSTKEGLSEREAKDRLKKLGLNKIKEREKFNLIKIILNQFKDLFSWLLIISAVITLILDKNDLIDSVLIISVVVFNSLLGVIQEGKASKALIKIKNLQSYQTRVLRDNKICVINSEELTFGDIVLVEEGDYIGADMRIIEANNLEVNEASITGESKSVLKTSGELKGDLSLGDQTNMLFSSSFVKGGTAKALVVKIGSDTEIGKIARSLKSTKQPKTPMMENLDNLTKKLGILIIGICILVYGLELFLTKDMLASFKSAVALSVAAIPEGLQTVITMVLAIGVLKLSKRNVIVKKMPAAETLGAVSVIALDKTGTITTGNLKLHDTVDLNGRSSKDVLYYAQLASNPESNDYTNRLLTRDFKFNEKPFKVIPFNSNLKYEVCIYKKGSSYQMYVKGAFDLLVKDSRLINLAKGYTKECYRVLAVGKKNINNLDENPLTNLEILGFVLFEEEIRGDVKESIKRAKKAHILPIMITGDYQDTAIEIAKRVDLLNKDSLVYTREMLDSKTDEEMMKDLDKIQIYSRVNPLDKLRIIELWQKKSHTIAMTGDGVNDAAALKKADIGIAMGNASDITKDSSDIILLNNDFKTILDAASEGRRMFFNVKKTIRYLLSSNIGEVLTILIATILSFKFNRFSIPFLPIHLLWINLVTDTLPAIALGMDDSCKDYMNSPPRKKTDGLLSKLDIKKIIIEGVFGTLIVLLAFTLGSSKGLEYARTMAFLAICLVQFIQAYYVKTGGKVSAKLFDNYILNLAVSLGLLFMVFPLFVFQSHFGLVILSAKDYIITILLSLLIWQSKRLTAFIK